MFLYDLIMMIRLDSSSMSMLTFCLDNGTGASLSDSNNVQGHLILDDGFFSLETF